MYIRPNKLHEMYFGAVDICKRYTGLNVGICSMHGGVRFNNIDKCPNVLLYYDKYKKELRVSVSEHPKILSRYHVKRNELDLFQDGIDYIARNQDLFTKHYNSTNYEFNDVDLYFALKERGEYTENIILHP